MEKLEKWEEFIENMARNASEEYIKSGKCVPQKGNYNKIESILTDNLTVEQKKIVEDCMFKMHLSADNEAGFLYKQGMRDCVFILTQLGVLA